MAQSNRCQGTIHTCKVDYVSGTSARIKALSDEVIPVLSKPKGTVTRAELEAAFKKVHDLQFADPPLTAQEYIHRQSFVLALMNRAPETGMTPQELMNRSDVVAVAIGSMAFSGGGVGGSRGTGGAGPVLPRTSSSSGQIKLSPPPPTPLPPSQPAQPKPPTEFKTQWQQSSVDNKYLPSPGKPPQDQPTGKGSGVAVDLKKGQQKSDFVSDHAYEKHRYDSSKKSTKNRTQYGKDVDPSDIKDKTLSSPDSVEKQFDASGNHYATTYKKEFPYNISTSDTPTNSSRVVINHSDPSRSTQFPRYVPPK
jgi:hypothetical protein